jgi:c-di-GMP-binding flagellar brake protein YcgR
MPHTKPERRSQRRVPARLSVSIRSPQGSAEAAGQTRDLSAGGIFLYTDRQISQGSELELVLILPAELGQGKRQWVCCQAVVVRVEDQEDGDKEDRRFGVAASVRSMEILPEIAG